MELYISNYESFNDIFVYEFKLGDGGIGDFIKFFMFILVECMKNNTRLYYLKNNTEIERYIKLKHDKMFIDEKQIKILNNFTIVKPQMYYDKVNYDWNIAVKDVFYFTDDIKINSRLLFSIDSLNYISIHLRLGDAYLETEKQFVLVKNDKRIFSEEKIYTFIEENIDKQIFFCCDNISRVNILLLLDEKTTRENQCRDDDIPVDVLFQDSVQWSRRGKKWPSKHPANFGPTTLRISKTLHSLLSLRC